MGLKIFYCVVVLLLCTAVNAQDEACTNLTTDFTAQKQEKFLDNLSSLTPRYVKVTGNDNETCLNYWNTTQPPACKTLKYALSGGNSSVHSNNGVAIYLSPGSFRSVEATVIIDSERVAIIGSGVDKTFFNCAL